MSEIWSFYGAEATGKTTLGFSAIQAFPDGILVHFDLDLGRDRAIWRFPDVAHRIKTVAFPEVPTWTLGSGAITRSWAKFERTYEMALNDPEVRVLFVDTGTQMHRLNADEYLENYIKRNRPNRTQLQQIEYRIPNSRTRAKIMAAREAQKLLVISHYETSVYAEEFVQQPDGSIRKESVNTNRKTHAGFGDIAYMSDQHLRLFLRDINGSLVPFVKFLKPNPLAIYNLEVPEPTYIKLTQIIAGIKNLELSKL